jgi:DNA/RNA-binding domain of Phe-tRNA-synthetase-like protein
MFRFRYDAALLDTYPSIVGGMIAARVRNAPTPPDLLAQFSAEQQATLARIGSTPLSDLPSLSAWRGAFRRFGVDPTQYRSACEALLRRLTKKGDIPSINALVDIGNLVSIRSALPVAMLDTRALAGGLTARFADGGETFTNLDQSQVDHPEPGEVIFVDAQRQVHARRWCWRQSDQSAARDDTTALLVTIEAHHDGGRADVERAVQDIIVLLTQYTDATCESAILDRANPAF